MINKTKNYFNNQCFIDLRYTTDEKAIFEHFIINHGLFKYLVEIVTNTDCKIKFSLENPKNNLRMKIGCNSFSNIYQLLLINDETNVVIANLQEDFLQLLTKIEQERLFDYINRVFIAYNSAEACND